MTTPYPNNPIIWPALPHDHTGDNQLGYYTQETTQRFTSGTRGITWDGKVFKYGRSKATLVPGMGSINSAQNDVSDLPNSSTTIAIVAGDRSTTLTLASTEGYDSSGGLAENELVGAQFVIGHGATGTGETRTIMSNTYLADGGGTSIITVDAPWVLAHAAGFSETVLNPYHYMGLASTSNGYGSVMGMPNVAATTGQFYWMQTWGPCWVTPGGGDSTPGDSANDRTVYFVGDGSVNGGAALTLESGSQQAGFIIDGTETGTGCMPLVMLQLSI